MWNNNGSFLFAQSFSLSDKFLNNCPFVLLILKLKCFITSASPCVSLSTLDDPIIPVRNGLQLLENALVKLQKFIEGNNLVKANLAKVLLFSDEEVLSLLLAKPIATYLNTEPVNIEGLVVYQELIKQLELIGDILDKKEPKDNIIAQAMQARVALQKLNIHVLYVKNHSALNKRQADNSHYLPGSVSRHGLHKYSSAHASASASSSEPNHTKKGPASK